MIEINRLKELLLQLQTDVNAQLTPGHWLRFKNIWVNDGSFDHEQPGEKDPKHGKEIDTVILSATEAHLVKKISDKLGILLAFKMPDADSYIRTADDYAENNHCLLYLLEKINPSNIDEENETFHYAKIQHIMKLIKEWILEHGLNGSEDDGEETLHKTFRTEWEYQVFAGFNGMSIGFDLTDFSL